MTTLLLDADVFAYQHANTHQQDFDWGDGVKSRRVGDIGDAARAFDDHVERLVDTLKASRVIVCLSCPTIEGWRIKLLPDYKAGRGEKPVLLADIKQHMRETYETFERPTMEADDIMGILATHPRLVTGKKIIVSNDKDMKTIPARIYNHKTGERMVVDEHTADYWHLYQTIVGDTVDHYKGCPGAGPVAARRALMDGDDHRHFSLAEMWERTVALFKSRGFTEDDALIQARVARICRHTDYDFKKREVKLWQPPS